jgi:hypothetical protein
VYVGSTSGTNKDEGSVKLMKEVTGTQGQVIGFDANGNAVAQEIAQSNWNQNDETAPDYVKNRTHWIDSDTTTINWDGDFESEGLITAYGYMGGMHLNYVKVSDSTPSLNEICNNGVVVMCMDVNGSENSFDLTQDKFIETESGYISAFLAVAYVDN